MSQRFRSALVWAAVVSLSILACGSWIYFVGRPPIGQVVPETTRATVPTPRALTEDDLEHGTRELEQMLKSRPAMRKHLQPGDAMWEWARRQFAGEYLPTRIVWLSDDPSKNQDAECRYDPAADPPAFIRVRPVWATGAEKGQEKPFDVLWSEAAFELHNIRTSIDAVTYWKQACAGKLTKEQWIRKNVARELEAARQTHEFYQAVWRPYCQENSIRFDPRWWWVNTSFNLDEFLAYSTAKGSPNAYWYDYWNSTWDNIIAPYLASTGRAPGKRSAASRPAGALGQ